MKKFGIVAALFFVACGLSRTDYIGTWSVSGTMTMNASGPGGNYNGSNTLSGNQSIIAGTDANQIILVDDKSSCNVPFTVAGSTATVQNGFSCSSTDANGGRTTLLFKSGSMVHNGTSINVNTSGDLTYTLGGSTATGTFNLALVMNKIGG